MRYAERESHAERRKGGVGVYRKKAAAAKRAAIPAPALLAAAPLLKTGVGVAAAALVAAWGWLSEIWVTTAEVLAGETAEALVGAWGWLSEI